MQPTFVRPVVLLLVAASATLAEAQVLDRPARPFGGLFGGEPPADPARTRHELTFTASLLGTQGDPLTSQSGHPVTNLPTSSGGFADAALAYARAGAPRTALQTFELEGRAYGAWYRRSTEPLWGGEVNARATIAFGRRSGLDGWARVRTDPFMALGAFAPIVWEIDAGDVPDANPTNGLSAARSWSSYSSASFHHQLSQRSTFTADYGHSLRDVPGGQGYDTATHRATLGLERSIGRGSGLDVTYWFADTETMLDASDAIPLEQHTVESTYRHGKRLSRTETLRFVIGGGATHAWTLSTATRARHEDWGPIGRAGIGLDFGRTWSVGADYRRSLTVLYGVSADSYVTDAVWVRAGGMLGPRLDLSLVGSYSAGRAAVAEAGRARYETYRVTGQLRYAIAGPCAFVANYSLYQHEFRDAADLPETFPRRLERGTVQAGLTFWVPLHRTRAPRAGSTVGTDAAR